MTEKRFYLNNGEVGTLKILDLKKNNENIYLTHSKSDMEGVVELLNESHEENEQLNKVLKCHRERIIILSYLLDLADAIIDLGDNEDSKEIWEKTNDNMDSKWEELMKKVKRDYTSRGIYDD